jgi:hypothetical protein
MQQWVMAKGQEATISRLKDDVLTCEKQTDLLLDMRLNEQISEQEYISKKCVLVNQKAELRGKLEAFEQNRQNRFEPATRFILEAKQATFLLAEGNSEQKRDFLKKIGSNFQMAEKSLAVEFKKPWNLLAEFNSAQITKDVACDEISSKSKWRREGDSNTIYTVFGFRVTDRDRSSQVATFAFICNCIFSFQLPCFSDRL